MIHLPFHLCIYLNHLEWYSILLKLVFGQTLSIVLAFRTFVSFLTTPSLLCLSVIPEVFLVVYHIISDGLSCFGSCNDAKYRDSILERVFLVVYN